MYTFGQALNIGFWLRCRGAMTPAVITAGAGNDNVAVNGLIVDRQDLGLRIPMSAKVSVTYVATVNTAETLSAAVKIQHGTLANGSDMTDYVDEYGHGAIASAVIQSGPLTAQPGVLEINVACDGMRRYVRVVTTFDLSRTGTDTVATSAQWIFGGIEAIPTTDAGYSVSA
jgi:hypothetical protein